MFGFLFVLILQGGSPAEPPSAHRLHAAEPLPLVQQGAEAEEAARIEIYARNLPSLVQVRLAASHGLAACFGPMFVRWKACRAQLRVHSPVQKENEIKNVLLYPEDRTFNNFYQKNSLSRPYSVKSILLISKMKLLDRKCILEPKHAFSQYPSI